MNALLAKSDEFAGNVGRVQPMVTGDGIVGQAVQVARTAGPILRNKHIAAELAKSKPGS